MENNLEKIVSQIVSSANKSDRDANNIKLIAASKTQTAERVREFYDSGHKIFGENRFQEGREKIPLLPADTEWHFIGGLQRNKVKDIIKLFEWIHSVDSISLLDEIEKRAAHAGKIQKILLEINVGGEANKHGAAPEDLLTLVRATNERQHVELHGLMTVAPFSEDLEEVRPYFAKLRELKETAERETDSILPELSMGMTHDFTIAIEEGATMVRVGTGLFGKRNYGKTE
ncbi:MAG: YggS family pyridoxal phosphate-dependent enzyme [Verrucomicrobiota bacterium]